MKDKLKITKMLFISLAFLILCAGSAAAQERLRSGETVSGEIGGESHANYFIYARRGQTITAVITRRVARGGNFNLSVTRGARGRNAPGRTTSGRRQLVWTGRAAANGNYYFDMTAYPTTSYRIRVTVR